MKKLKLLKLNKKSISNLNQISIKGGEDTFTCLPTVSCPQPCNFDDSLQGAGACTTDRTVDISVCFQHCQDK